MASDSSSSQFPRGFLQTLRTNLREFSGFGSTAPLLWTRWIYLRAVGAVFVVIFGGIIAEQSALAGSGGLLPVSSYLSQLAQSQSSAWQAFIHAPSLFWIDSSDTTMTLLAWVGMGASIGLVLNLWPRLALFVCWLSFLSFVTTWRVFSGAQLDGLMLEVALLSIPFAPAGLRPRLGGAPWSLAVFMMRWLLFRVMFESGLVKVLVADPHWRDWTAMDYMYETAPFPTIFGFFDHNMPHAYHVFEILLTYLAELIAPVLAFVAGRKGRWIAFASWTIFQAGIQLTNNFGWLNTASIGLGLLLLDDTMLRQAAGFLRLSRMGKLPSTPAVETTPGPAGGRRGFRLAGSIALWLHFAFASLYLAKIGGVRIYDFNPQLTSLLNGVARFQSANEYYLYARVKTTRIQVEFAGSNDNGLTWRPYKYRYLVQNEDQINGFIAPRFVRFDASLQIVGIVDQFSKLVPVVASHLLQPNPKVVGLFAKDPFPDQPPTIVRMRRYRLKFTDLATWRETGRYWQREPAGDYAPPMGVDEDGRIRPFDLSAGEAALSRGNPSAALAIFDQQYTQGYLSAGFRLVDMYMRGMGTLPDPVRAFVLLTDLAKEGEIEAINHLGACYEYGLGVDVDYVMAARHYRRAVEAGHPLAFFSLGSLYARGHLTPHDDVEALALLLVSASRSESGNPVTKFINANQPGLVRQLKSRMTAEQIATAEDRAANWP